MNTSFSKIRHIQEANMRLEKRLLGEASISHQNGYAIIDGKPYKIEKGAVSVKVKNLVANQDGSATLSWSALGGMKTGDDVITRDAVNKIVNDLKTKGDSTMMTKAGEVSIVPAK